MKGKFPFSEMRLKLNEITKRATNINNDNG